jgi:hypothetical protein
MPLAKPAAAPGFLSQATQVQAGGAWYLGNLVRWRTGLLEKWGGWRRLINDQLPSVIRRMHAWLDLGNRKNLLVACDSGVSIVVQDTLYGLGRGADLEGGYFPVLGPTSDTTKFSVTIGTTEVTVKTSRTTNVGASFFFRGSISIGGRIISAGSFFLVKNVVPGTGFTFDMPLSALASETDTYGLPLLTNDIVNGFTVTWKAHGLSAGQSVRLAQATKLRVGVVGEWAEVNFVAPAGTVLSVASVVDADHFTVSMSTFGTGDGLGGASHQVFVGTSIEQSGVSGDSVGAVIGLAAQRPLGNPQRGNWFLGNQGEKGLVLASGGPLEVYSPPIENGPFLQVVGGGPPATAPQHSNGMITTMPQGQVVLFGTEPGVAKTNPDGTITLLFGQGVIDPLQIRWSDVGTYDVYTPSVSNQAGGFRLYQGSRIVGMIQAPQATLILTDTDLWQMSYIGPPLIYGFTIMGSGCGLIAPHAIGKLGRSTIWQGQKNFWQFGDTSAQPVQCTVWDYIFNDIDPVNINKCHAAPNSTTNEMAFYFPSKELAFNVGADDLGNLLLFSGDLTDLSTWVTNGAVPVHFTRLLHVFYLYEPENRAQGWFDDNGLSFISWLDRDLQADLGSAIYAPDGSLSAFLLQEDSSDGVHELSQTIIKPSERVTFTLSIYVHDSSLRNLTLRAAAGGDGVYATFDVTSGHVMASGVTTPRFTLVKAIALPDNIGQGTATWRRFVLTFTTDSDDTLRVSFTDTNGTNLSYVGESKGALVWGPQLVLGADPLDYQVTGGTPQQNETRRYVKVNVAEGMAWDSGEFGRSAWLDESVWGPPLGGDITPIGPPMLPAPQPRRVVTTPPPPRNLIQQHEIGFDDDDQPMVGVFAETGYTETGDGTMLMLIDQCHPDMKWFGNNGGVRVSLRAKMYPQGPSHLYGPWSMTPGTQWFNPRVRTRYVAVRYDWEAKLGFSARVGVTTFHMKTAGRLP